MGDAVFFADIKGTFQNLEVPDLMESDDGFAETQHLPLVDAGDDTDTDVHVTGTANNDNNNNVPDTAPTSETATSTTFTPVDGATSRAQTASEATEVLEAEPARAENDDGCVTKQKYIRMVFRICATEKIFTF